MNRMTNTVSLAGNLGQAPELKTLASGRKVCNASIAISERYLNKEGETVENTDWHRIVAWGKTAEILASQPKGARVLVSGKLKNSSYEDKDGNKRYNTDIVINEIYALATAAKKEAVPF